MPKPSERIAEIYREIASKDDGTFTTLEMNLMALEDYLDEEWRKSNPSKALEEKVCEVCGFSGEIVNGKCYSSICSKNV